MVKDEINSRLWTLQNGFTKIPNEWLLDQNIKNEVILLIIIKSLCQKKGYCYASNDYLSDILKTSKSTIVRQIQKLKDCKYLKIEHQRQGCKIISRKIWVQKPVFYEEQKYASYEEQKYASTKPKNAPEIIKRLSSYTSYNQKAFKIKNTHKDVCTRVSLDDTSQISSRVIDYFNKTGILEQYFKKSKVEFHFKNTEANRKLIQNILDRGYTESNILDVIFLKYDQWIENNDKNKMDMSTFYRPSTVLGEKFDEYYQEAKVKGVS